MSDLKGLGFGWIPSDSNFFMVNIGRDVTPEREEFRRKGILVGRKFPPLDTWLRVSVGTATTCGGSWRPSGKSWHPALREVGADSPVVGLCPSCFGFPAFRAIEDHWLIFRRGSHTAEAIAVTVGKGETSCSRVNLQPIPVGDGLPYHRHGAWNHPVMVDRTHPRGQVGCPVIWRAVENACSVPKELFYGEEAHPGAVRRPEELQPEECSPDPGRGLAGPKSPSQNSILGGGVEKLHACDCVGACHRTVRLDEDFEYDNSAGRVRPLRDVGKLRKGHGSQLDRLEILVRHDGSLPSARSDDPEENLR
jgi:hypothetical protein